MCRHRKCGHIPQHELFMSMIKNDKPNKERIIDKEKLAHEQGHLVRPPRLEGVVKEAMMQPIRKKKRAKAKPDDGKASLDKRIIL